MKLNDIEVKIGTNGGWHEVLTLEIRGKEAHVCWGNQQWVSYPKEIVQYR